MFSTKDQSAAVSAQYFADSASKVSFFFEEGAVVAKKEKQGQAGEEQEQGEKEEDHSSSSSFELAVPKEDAVNKIGHALHDADETFRAFSRDNPRLLSLFKSLRYERPLPVQSMYICKPPKLGGEVVPHQDACFLRTTPERSVVGCWLALERAGVGNGCLWAVPGSHDTGKNSTTTSSNSKEGGGGLFLGHGRVFGRRRDGSVGWSSGASERDDDGADGGESEKQQQQQSSSSTSSSSSSPYDAAPELSVEGAVPLEAEPGTLVLLDGAVVHFSRANDGSSSSSTTTTATAAGEGQGNSSSGSSSKKEEEGGGGKAAKKPAQSRHAYALHVVEGGKGISWHERNWLQRPGDAPFVPLY